MTATERQAVETNLATVREALDPRRFFAAVGGTPDGEAFLRGAADSVLLSREFLTAEAALAQNALAAIDALEKVLLERD